MIRISDATKLLIEEFDELKKEHDEDITGLDYSEVPGCFYQCVFVPYIIKQLDEQNEPELKKVFAFIENLFADGDEDISYLVIEDTIESICGDYDYSKYKDAILDSCGELTRKAFEDAEAEIIAYRKQRTIA